MTEKGDILHRILQRKQQEIAERKRRAPPTSVERQAKDIAPARGFYTAIQSAIDNDKPAVVAEIKKASPSKGVIRQDFDPITLAHAYTNAGASCLSILTDADFFQGEDRHIHLAKQACPLPILRKDFILDPYQVHESRIIGADCILLIVAALGDNLLQELAGIALELGMDVLVEVHDREELERAHMLRTPLIGINNRDLRTFRTDLETTIGLLTDVFPDRTVVTESGIHSRDDVALMRKHGVNAFLVGEALLSAADPGKRLRELFTAL